MCWPDDDNGNSLICTDVQRSGLACLGLAALKPGQGKKTVQMQYKWHSKHIFMAKASTDRQTDTDVQFHKKSKSSGNHEYIED